MNDEYDSASKTRLQTETIGTEEDVGGISEITILPDGRVYVLGLSSAVRQALHQSGPWCGRLGNSPEENAE
jgi:hypothetical protein